MPATPMKNMLYRAALPFLAPSVRGRLKVSCFGHPMTQARALVRVLEKHHVLGAAIRLTDGDRTAQADVSVVSGPLARNAKCNTMYRVASITKTATALVMLRLTEAGVFSLDDSVDTLLPAGSATEKLKSITVRQLLSHTSGLRDIPACDAALARGDDFHTVLNAPGVIGEKRFAYCNFGFGLLGCVIEHVTQKPVSAVFDELLFCPLGMRATLDGSTLNEGDIMPITRVLSRRKSAPVRITSLGRIPLTSPDPLHHFGHTAGAMYTDAPSLSRMLTLIAQEGQWESHQLLTRDSIREMLRPHASYGSASPTLQYGLGMLLIDDPSISDSRIIGHQGFAYGCVDGAFVETGTGRQIISLNGGASEARTGRMGDVNRDVLRYALKKELPQWK